MREASLPGRLRAGTALPVADIPRPAVAELADQVVDAVGRGCRVVAWFGRPAGAGVELCVVLADDTAGQLDVAFTTVLAASFPALTPRCPEVHLFEREIAEQTGLLPEGHPWLQPVRFPGSDTPGHLDFFRVAGAGMHEVGVGPVHAGVIEPGHFRFQCHGETVFHLEIALGYQHRGVERALLGGPDRRSLHYAETLAGDTTVGHATAYCQLVEALGDVTVPPRAEALRAIALELERLASHVGDLGALAGDVGFLPTAAFCGRIRGDFLNLTAELCGNRFGRGLLIPGGVGFDLDDDAVPALLARLDHAAVDTRVAVELLWDSASVMARFEGCGALSATVARQLGLVGPAARAAGLERDARHCHPPGLFSRSRPDLVVDSGGDVLARAQVRWREIQCSLAWVRDQLTALPHAGGAIRAPQPTLLASNHLAATLVEGWRGEVCHVAISDDAGAFACYKVVDPSFHNWSGLAYALRGQQISDFPLCNKSFNLSYCGHDL